MNSRAVGLIVLSMIFAVVSSHAVTYLGPSTKTRKSNSKDDSKSSSNKPSSYKASNNSSASDDVDAGIAGISMSYLEFLAPEDVPDDWLPGRFRASAEFGLQHWMPYSSSGQYDASYDIDPVTTTIFETGMRVKSWIFLFDYTTSLMDPDRVENLLGQVSRINPGAGAWWSLYAERGRVEGVASTVDQFGNPVEYPVDTVWNRIGIDWRTFEGYALGLVYEDLTMPMILTFNNEQVAFAVFDEAAQARTLSISLGYDRARRLLNSFEEGGAWAWALEGSLGLGWLSYSEDEARQIIEAQGYEFESSELLLTGAIDGRLGYTYSKTIWGSDVQCFTGVRLRASGWSNLASSEPEEGVTELDASFGLVIPGVFARFSFQW